MSKGLCLLIGAGSAFIYSLSSGPAWADDPGVTLAPVEVTASRLGEGVVGASTSVITAADIAADPSPTLPTILARQAGVQLQSLFGGVAGADSTIGLRGFGATASENTLILVNGRRINDPDQSGIDFTAIPIESIERIEITRGNSGAVLYGDGAVGGVINIITKNGFTAPPSAGIEAGLGSFGEHDLSLHASQTAGNTALSAYGSDLNANGWRDNNALREKNFVGEIRQSFADGEAYLNLRSDDQHLGLPGALSIAPGINQYAADPKASDSPTAWGGLQGFNLTFGGTKSLESGLEAVIDAGVRNKYEPTSYDGFYESVRLTTFSLTPRLLAGGTLLGLKSDAIAGIDLYQTSYASNYSEADGQTAYDRHDLNQRTIAAYGQETLGLTPATDLSFGLRLEQADVKESESVNPSAPGFYGALPGLGLSGIDNEYAAHLGIEHRLDGIFSLYGRIGHSMRMPNIDDRNDVASYPPNFELKTQTSNDVEAGVKIKDGRLDGQVSLYLMELRNEIDFDPGANGGFGANVNLDPTRRSGIETEAGYRLTDSLRLKGSATFVQAVFRAGPYRGDEVPQVAALTGNAGLDWDILAKALQFSADLRAVGPRYLGDDLANSFPKSPGYALVDSRIGGQEGPLSWSLSVQNLFDVKTYDQGYAGTSPGSYAVYPLPGRSFLGKIGVRF